MSIQAYLFKDDAEAEGSLECFHRFCQQNTPIKDHCLTGSRVICNPPVMDTDVDHLYLVEDLDYAGRWFGAEGWNNCLTDWLDKDSQADDAGYAVELDNGVRFQAWRKGEINVILTDDETLHLRNVAATLLAKQLNLTNKAERIKLFRCIKFGEPYGGRYQ